MYDSRLFNQSSGFAAGFNEDQPYDKPLFAERDALNSIYRPQVGDDDEEDGGETLEKIQGAKRFEGLGRAPKEGFKGTKTCKWFSSLEAKSQVGVQLLEVCKNI